MFAIASEMKFAIRSERKTVTVQSCRSGKILKEMQAF
jgi:hypothetical protein